MHVDVFVVKTNRWCCKFVVVVVVVVVIVVKLTEKHK
jgi:hypothetical protein